MRIANGGGSENQSCLGRVDTDAVRAEIELHGLSIAKNVVPTSVVKTLRETWLRAYEKPVMSAPVIWGPFLGEANRILFHRSHTCCMYRSYDFLWNPPIDPLTREIGLALNRIRNEVAESPPFSGEIIQSDRYGIYVTTTYYPSGEGWLVEHEDQADSRRHWHYTLQLTHKGNSYVDGGLYLVSRSGEKVDVDARVKPGDLVFFDGTRPHGVKAVSGGAGLGRLQMFSIPTFMETPQQNDRMLEDISITRFLKAKLRPLKRLLAGNRSGSGGAY